MRAVETVPEDKPVSLVLNQVVSLPERHYGYYYGNYGYGRDQGKAADDVRPRRPNSDKQSRRIDIWRRIEGPDQHVRTRGTPPRLAGGDAGSRPAATHGGGAAASRPGRLGLPSRARSRPRPRAPQHHRPRGRRAACPQRRPDRLDLLQRRGLQLRRAAPHARAARAPLLHEHRYRGHRPPVRGTRRRLRAGTERPVRIRALGPAAAPAAAGAGSCWHPAALLHPDAPRRSLRLRSQGAARERRAARSARPERARRDLHVLGAARAADDVQGRGPGVPGRDGRAAGRAARAANLLALGVPGGGRASHGARGATRSASFARS